LKYRPEIDGLRAIAVVSVILYHAQLVLFGRDWFGGGFIGVDIFFVISGYLITRIILSELESKGSFSFLNFYERRARRILPMLIVVILTSFPLAWHFFLPNDLIEYSKSILSSLFFGSNFFFYINTTEYGADSALLKPFLHTWSLGVEEQFYLVFPILAIVTFKYFRKHFLTILIGFSLLSLQFSELMEVRNSDLNFYLPFSRFWELAVGSMLAYREMYYKPCNEGFASKSLPMIGLYLVAYSILFFDAKTPHPSFHTLIPIGGVALIIAFASKDELVGKVLGTAPFVWLGLISYSAYLWHFPLFAFARIYVLELNNWIFLFLIISTLFLSFLSYQIIEKPFRDAKKITSKSFFYLMLVITSIIVLVGYLILKNDGYKFRIPFEVTTTSFDDRRAHYNEFLKCHRREGGDAIPLGEFCILGEGERSAYLIGDSHMASIAWQLSESLTNTQLMIMTQPAKIFGLDKNVDAHRVKVLEKVENSLVVFGGYAHRWNGDSEFAKKNRNKFLNDRTKKKYEKMISILLSNNNKVVIVYPIPSIDIDRRGLASEVMVRKRLLDKRIKLDDFENYSKRAFDFYDSLPFENLKRIYPHNLMCDDQYCYGVKNGDILISDFDHPSILTAKRISDKIVSNGFW